MIYMKKGKCIMLLEVNHLCACVYVRVCELDLKNMFIKYVHCISNTYYMTLKTDGTQSPDSSSLRRMKM